MFYVFVLHLYVFHLLNLEFIIAEEGGDCQLTCAFFFCSVCMNCTTHTNTHPLVVVYPQSGCFWSE